MLLKADNLVKHFPAGEAFFGRAEGTVRAVDGVSFEIGEGETLGLVGESGCGKSTVGRLVLRLLEPTSGRVLFRGEDLGRLDARALRSRRRFMQLMFQDPYGSLNPRMTVGDMIREPLVLHGLHRGAQDARVAELLGLVGLPGAHAQRYAHEFSGGQRQRIGIARALAAEPVLIVCDEPVSALDVSIQAQVINLLAELQARLGISYLFIAHDLAVVRHASSRIAVMYLGKIVEEGAAASLFQRPRHPYTQALLSAVPSPQASNRAKRILLEGDVPSALAPPSGCRFRTRCAHARERCAAEVPVLDEGVACHFWREIASPSPSGLMPVNERLARLQAAFRS
ncbi:MAG: ABC transporter ATP-binding protein [Betaproteobacteria bacterium]|nr:ABC transporter ATP-binding protein [Betaproteobacteria bacterium]